MPSLVTAYIPAADARKDKGKKKGKTPKPGSAKSRGNLSPSLTHAASILRCTAIIADRSRPTSAAVPLDDMEPTIKANLDVRSMARARLAVMEAVMNLERAVDGLPRETPTARERL